MRVAFVEITILSPGLSVYEDGLDLADGADAVLRIQPVCNCTPKCRYNNTQMPAGEVVDMAPTSSTFIASFRIGIDGGNVFISGINPSGTYRIIAFANKDGFFRAQTFNGTANVDGRFIWTGFQPEIYISFGDTTESNKIVIADRAPNGDQRYHDFGEPEAEWDLSTGRTPDFMAVGFKHRESGLNHNGTFQHVGLSWGRAMGGAGVGQSRSP